MANSQSEIQNPTTQYYTGEYPQQKQPVPGVQSKMDPVPDCGEKTYKGSGRLQDRKALVTGGDSGIGRAAAIAYAREGADVAINYLPAEEEDAQQVKQLIEEAGRKAVLIPGDLSDEKFARSLVHKAHQELGGLDVLALVAGKQVAVEKIADLTTEQFQQTYAVNVFALFWITQEALPLLPAGASIITTSSIQAYQPSPHLLDYASTKAAILNYSRGLAKQVAESGVRVNVIAPGPIWTALQISGGQPQEKIPQFGQQTPMKRAGQPAELAPVYVYLASQESSYVTAEVHGVCGGEHLG
ncbi:SDR family oxidoreductase [Leclercia adecarboxylata]|uniref:SDR family oxidoreductase n=1 Tax=Leclercia adecarboxylata TaxID=83655 RepID=A0ABU6I479_9ENTR|nr:SDR family oxidoreductase [Leclercia adecarboxylata]MBZ3799932.1 SDR family oxidoreductase [Leclercia adecarboxylata]MBZ3804151.1 SDR family oxidoreductase [Leclercia adecarboxylata]MDV5240924.1 SDR family oxidoreductase [Leclercia adecarboxylata]MDV5277488.1 SDR family oxidoreductase [Leclercia adecarboxylata]MDV5459926.1 SDR family oxidoreductase [Leclercia adecarboxylata]